VLRVEAALRQVDELGQWAIAELRRMLGLLVIDDATYEASGRPASLANIDQIIECVQIDDLHVELAVEGTPIPLDAGVDMCAYRIVQEALTNAVRYADLGRPVKLAVR
jgi:signal transduction histidine kinase